MIPAGASLSDEPRKQPRFPIRLSIEFWHDEVHGHGTVADLSRCGCTVESTTSVTIGMSLRLRIPLGSGEAPLKVDLAVIRWTTVGKFGLEFIIVPAESQERLRRFLSNL